jgi:hypothetical protein
MSGDGKTLCADIFAECEKRAMSLEIIGGRLCAFVDLDLLNARIAFDVKNAIGNE